MPSLLNRLALLNATAFPAAEDCHTLLISVLLTLTHCEHLAGCVEPQFRVRHASMQAWSLSEGMECIALSAWRFARRLILLHETCCGAQPTSQSIKALISDHCGCVNPGTLLGPRKRPLQALDREKPFHINLGGINLAADLSFLRLEPQMQPKVGKPGLAKTSTPGGNNGDWMLQKVNYQL